MNAWEILLGICVGIGLSAACGFRVFVPMFVMSIAAKAGHLNLASGFEWIESWPAIIAFGSATALEVGGYYVPWIDNLLDTVSTPAAIVAGSVATAAMVSGVHPMLQWSLGIIAGGGTATIVQGLTVVTRAASTATTGGVANQVVSTVEAGTSAGLSIVAVAVAGSIAALALGVLVVLTLWWLGRKLLRRRKPRSPATATGVESGIA